MHRLLCAAILCLAALPLHAAEQAKSNTLTPKEVADGWILLFDGGTTFGWTATDGSKWTVFDGMLAPQKGHTGALVTTTEFAEYEFQVEFQVRRDGKAHVVLGSGPDGKPGATGASEPFRDVGSGWHELIVRVTASGIVTETRAGNLVQVRTVRKSQAKVGRGHIALAGDGFIVRSIKLRPLNVKPLFNGKDLTGWKKYEGDKARSKSDFTVTKEGWLHVKNGPGDLQTVGQYEDFVLQLDCISNGKHLNSGIFFRCRPGEYQQGYEAQINNNFNAEKPKEYTLEEYDPKTHELKDKMKVKFAAVDYGTGAIYRRMPARKQMAKDGEWFTMTVVAHGRHFATWVNGVQVVDWADNRPLKDNARNGCRLGKGPISIQGHDPTTDLSFRNLRIAELPKPEK